jgi:hypothetical protein
MTDIREGTAADRRHDADRRHFDTSCADLKRRIENVTAHMNAADLNALVVKMTRLRFKYRTRSGMPLSWRRDRA